VFICHACVIELGSLHNSLRLVPIEFPWIRSVVLCSFFSVYNLFTLTICLSSTAHRHVIYLSCTTILLIKHLSPSCSTTVQMQRHPVLMSRNLIFGFRLLWHPSQCLLIPHHYLSAIALSRSHVLVRNCRQLSYHRCSAFPPYQIPVCSYRVFFYPVELSCMSNCNGIMFRALFVVTVASTTNSKSMLPQQSAFSTTASNPFQVSQLGMTLAALRTIYN
jgi:hypothetical protein